RIFPYASPNYSCTVVRCSPIKGKLGSKTRVRLRFLRSPSPAGAAQAAATQIRLERPDTLSTRGRAELAFSNRMGTFRRDTHGGFGRSEHAYERLDIDA